MRTLNTKTLIVASVFAFAIAGAVHAATITVRRDGTGDFTTIQPAVDAAAPGDTVNIGPGEYTEYQTIRPPLWDWDIDIYVLVTADNLTLLGAGADQTVVGPLIENIDGNHYSPKVIWAGSVNSLSVENVAIRNCYTGIYSPTFDTSVRGCHFGRTRFGITVFSSSIVVEDSAFEGIGQTAKAIAHVGGYCNNSQIRDCRFDNTRLYLDDVSNFRVENCTFQGGSNAIGVLFGSSGTIDNCTITNSSRAAIELKSSICTLDNSVIANGEVGIKVEGGQLYANYVTITGTTVAAIYVGTPDSLRVNYSNIVPNIGFCVKCYESNGPASSTYDMTHNYWGASDSTAIAVLIWDGQDSAMIRDYIDFTPFANEVAVKHQTWGAVKALFRGATK